MYGTPARSGRFRGSSGFEVLDERRRDRRCQGPAVQALCLSWRGRRGERTDRFRSRLRLDVQDVRMDAVTGARGTVSQRARWGIAARQNWGDGRNTHGTAGGGAIHAPVWQRRLSGTDPGRKGQRDEEKRPWPAPPEPFHGRKDNGRGRWNPLDPHRRLEGPGSCSVLSHALTPRVAGRGLEENQEPPDRMPSP